MSRVEENGLIPKMPTRFVRLGGEITRYGCRLVCCERPSGLAPCDACKGCFFSLSRYEGSVIQCNDIQCSSFDRMDGLNVWFVPRGGWI